MKIKRKLETGRSTQVNKFHQWTDQDLINCIEAQMRRSGELFRGLNHHEMEQAWVLGEMEIHVDTALQAVRALRDRVAHVQSL